MQQLDSFLRDTKDTLRVIELINKQVDKGTIDLEGAAFLLCDVVQLYPSMPEELGLKGSKEYLEKRPKLICPELIKGINSQFQKWRPLTAVWGWGS